MHMRMHAHITINFDIAIDIDFAINDSEKSSSSLVERALRPARLLLKANDDTTLPIATAICRDER